VHRAGIRKGRQDRAGGYRPQRRPA
jgi:hypothetical protein